MMTNTKLTHDLDKYSERHIVQGGSATSLDWMDAPIKSEKWRNLSFMKNGSSSWGENIHPSESAAKKVMDEWELDAIKLGYPKNDVYFYSIKDWYSNYSHTIQIPWRQD